MNQKNQILLNLNRDVYGIIDKDSREESEIKKLEKSHVFVLSYDEIENLFISSLILDKICKTYNLENKSIQFKNKVLMYAKNHRNEIISDYVRKTYKRKQDSGKYKYNGKLDTMINDIEKQNNTNLKKYRIQLENFISDFDKCIEEKNYEKIIMNTQDKGLIKCVSLLDLNVDEYIDKVIELIKNDNEFKKDIILNFFSFFEKII